MAGTARDKGGSEQLCALWGSVVDVGFDTLSFLLLLLLCPGWIRGVAAAAVVTFMLGIGPGVCAGCGSIAFSSSMSDSRRFQFDCFVGYAQRP